MPSTGHERRRFWAYVGVVVAMVVGFTVVTGNLRETQSQSHRLRVTQRALKATTEDLQRAVAQIRTDERRVADVNRSGTHGSCVQLNRVRAALVGFVSDSLGRARLNRKVVYANPAATAGQRGMADLSIRAIAATLADYRKRMMPERCP